MKKTITLAMLSLGLSTPAFANYSCDNSTMTAHLNIEQTDPSTVKATVDANGVQEVYTGTYDPTAGYSMVDAKSQAIGLEVKTTIRHSNGCPRCGPSDYEVTVAKLTLPSGEAQTFTCE